MAEEQSAVEHLLLNGDGGCFPANPGPAGWGIHGYFFTMDLPKKGAGQNNNVLTAKGYEVKTANALTSTPQVTPLRYVDGYGGFPSVETNNVGELSAFIKAMEVLMASSAQSLHYITDSKYVVDGFKEHLSGWVRNGWLKRDGQPPANLNLWKQALAHSEQVAALGRTMTLAWVKGHSGDLGNDCADALATAGCVASGKDCMATQTPYQDIRFSEPDGYWKTENDRHPLLAYTSSYFTTRQRNDDHRWMYVGEHEQAEDSEFLGKEIAEGAHAVICLNEPNPILSALRKQTELDCNGDDVIMVTKLSAVYRPETFHQLSTYKHHAFYRSNPRRLNYRALDDVELMMEKNPAGLAYRSLDVLVILEEMLVKIRAGQTEDIPGYMETELTHVFFDTVYKINNKLNKMINREKGPAVLDQTDPFFTVVQQLHGYGSDEAKVLIAEQTQFKAAYKPGVSKLVLELNYKDKADVVKQEPVGLYFGIDFPVRNALKRMETLNPKVKLITWRIAPTVFRYVTYFECDDAFGLCGGMYTNTRVMLPATPQS